MRLLTLLLLPATLLAGPSRYARLGDFQGPVEVQLTAADPWMPAERNLPLTESAWLRTGPGARLEIELDDGGAWRLGPDSLGEISDYTRLSTGQRITLLSLDHGTAYYSGQPRGKDVVMLVVPGAQMSVLQGSRIRAAAQSGWSQIAVLEGQVRFSSPAAEMDIREGTTARVEPATPSRFFLYPEVKAEALDRWSEDRDKLQTAPPSATHVTARYGLSDLDTAGKWLSTADLGLVWKPEVAADWAPYQKGRWRYFEALGYTWVSDDPWGWLPYHNGRWARKDNLGWVWQPAASAVFRPGEVYWLRGGNFTGWGPLAPGEMWTAPQYYATGNTTYAPFQPDLRTIDPSGFPAPAAEQLKTAVFVPALPSPAFLTSRLDATRPVLKVGGTRIVPSVPGVTLGDTPPVDPPSDLMTNPINDPPPPAVVGDASGGVAPPPDGVYPVPVAAIPVIEIPVVVINPPEHQDYSRRPGNQNNGNRNGPPIGNQPAPAVPSVPATSNSPAQNPSASRTAGNQPVHQHPPDTASTAPPPATPVSHAPAGQPVHEHPPVAAAPPPPVPPAASPAVREHPAPPPPQAPKVDPPKGPDKKGAAMMPGELELYRQLQQDVIPPAPNFVKALADLNNWTRKFPDTAFENDRLYYYIHVYNGMGRGDKVLDTAAALISAGVGNTYPDQQQVLQILVAASAGLQKLANATPQQLATGRKAAQQLLEFLPDYFSSRRKPDDISDAAWSIARTQLETVAKQALARKSVALTAAN